MNSMNTILILRKLRGEIVHEIEMQIDISEKMYNKSVFEFSDSIFDEMPQG